MKHSLTWAVKHENDPPHKVVIIIGYIFLALITLTLLYFGGKAINERLTYKDCMTEKYKETNWPKYKVSEEMNEFCAKYNITFKP